MLLYHLVSQLSKAQLGRIKEGPNLSHFDKLSNVSISLNYLKQRLKLPNIGAEDIVDGNSKLIQGLIWTLITYFLVDADVEEDDAQIPSEIDGKKLTPKERLLEWVKFIANSYPGVTVKSWSSFDDGLALCAMVHFHYPRVLDFYALDQKDRLANIQTVLAVLEKRWGIPHLVDSVDLLNGRVPEDMLLALVATCKKELKNPPMEITVLEGVAERYAPSTPAVIKKKSSLRDALNDEEGPPVLSRPLLRRVAEHAEQGNRRDMDVALAEALELFRKLVQELDDASQAATAPRRAQLRSCRERIDRGLRDLLDDSACVCRHKESPVYRQLLRRDITALCSAEHDARKALDDETDSTSKVLNQRLRAMRADREPERILQTSKLLEAENLRLAGAAKSKVEARASQLESVSHKVAKQMVQELEALGPRFAPLAERLAQNPEDRQTQRELAELNREISNIVADLDVTMEVDASKELHNLNRVISNAFVRFRTEVLDGCLRATKAVSSRCQDALSATRKACQTLPKSRSKPVLARADTVDDSLTQLQKAAQVADSPSLLEKPMQQLKNAAEDLTAEVERTERDMRHESAVPQVKDAVAGVLIAIRQGDKASMKKRSDELTEGGNRAIEVALQRKERAVDPTLVDSYVRDLQHIQPLHQESTQLAVAMNPPDRPTLRRVAETARDVLNIVLELEEASQPSQGDEFAHLAALVSGIGDVLVDGFDLVVDTRDAADSTRKAVVENPAQPDAIDLLATIEELEAALPSMVLVPETEQDRQRAAHSKASMVQQLPKMEKAVKKREKERAVERTAEPTDDMVRLARYARAGVQHARIQELKDGVQRKSQDFVKKKRSKAHKVEDPIRQQRIMESLAELESMAPLVSALRRPFLFHTHAHARTHSNWSR